MVPRKRPNTGQRMRPATSVSDSVRKATTASTKYRAVQLMSHGVVSSRLK